MLEYDFLYKIMYEMTTVFESSSNQNELILGLKQVFKMLAPVSDLNIFIYDELTCTFKNFAKPWENITDVNEVNELKDIYAKLDGKNYSKAQNVVYFPLYKQRKLVGLVKVNSAIEDSILEKISSLLSRQISLAVVHLEYFEGVKNNARFYETARNIMKITETQYDLSYILPIMGEMIDGFIREHLIYIFLKKSGKKDYKLIWPSKCLINNIEEYLYEIKDSNPIIKDDSKTYIFPKI